MGEISSGRFEAADYLCFKESPREGNSDFINFCEVSPGLVVSGS